MTVFQAINLYVGDSKSRERIFSSFQRRSVSGTVSVDNFLAQYDYVAVLNFPGIGPQTADALMSALEQSQINN